MLNIKCNNEDIPTKKSGNLIYSSTINNVTKNNKYVDVSYSETPSETNDDQTNTVTAPYLSSDPQFE